MTRIPWWQPKVGAEELRLLQEVLESNFLNDGEFTTRLEQQISERLGCRHAVAVTSGTTALYMSLAALDVGPGDEVVVPAITFIATANAVTMAGATPVLVDVLAGTLNMDPAAFEAAITPRTKAVMPVHISGRSADMPAILAIARRHGIAVVEDAAEALKSTAHGSALGTHGALGCFSFSPNKTITTGQGGMIVTNDDALVIRLRQLKDQGRPVRGTGGDDEHPVVGYNFKLTNLQAAIGLAQLERLDGRVARMQDTYRRYRDGLAGVAGVRLFGFDVDAGEIPQWVDAECDRRDELDSHLAALGMDCRRFWRPLHQTAPYRQPDEAFPVASVITDRSLWFPSAFTLTDADIDEVCGAVRDFYGQSDRAPNDASR